MAHAGGPTAQANYAGPRTPLQSERQEQKRDLASWWKKFNRSDKKPQEVQVPQGIFGVPLQQSIRYANVAISLMNDEGHSYIYGYVPIVVAKCGVYLKEKATETEGIFRLAGSEKRIKELKVAFDSPDRFGKGLDWTGYTVHDAANILRRYFNQLPEPIIPLDFYNRFRDPLRNHQAQAVGQIEAQSPSVGEFDPDATIQKFQRLITELPPLNRQLLLYILDLLAVFASKSDMNKMTTPNLAAIFQPGILSHPSHDMAPPEYRLSQDVLIFLIENQDSFLIGMQGTEADAQTVKDVQNGTPTKAPGSPSTPGRSKTIVGRTSSNASTRAESVRKVTDLRRNVSVSSKQSKRSENGPTPVQASMSPSGSVHRSNTVPSRRDGSSAHSPRISSKKINDPATPPTEGPAIVVDSSKPRQESLQSTPVAAASPQFPAGAEAMSTSSGEASAILGSDGSSATTRDYQIPKKDTTPLIAPPAKAGEQAGAERYTAQTPSTSPGRFLDIFKQSPPGGEDARKPNKLQKRRIPGTSLSSAQSSSQSLGNEEQQDATQRSPVSPVTAPADMIDVRGEQPGTPIAVPIAVPVTQKSSETLGEPTMPANTQATLAAPPRNLSADYGLRPTISPSHSYRSATESDTDMVGDDMPKEAAPPAEKERKQRRWRFSRPHNKLESSPAPSPNPLGAMTGKEQATSRSTVGSNGGGGGRRSFQEPTPLTPSATDPLAMAGVGTGLAQGQTFSSSSTDPAPFSDSERERKGGGPMSWIRGKMSGNREKEREREVDRRARTPERVREPPRDNSRAAEDLYLATDALPVRGKSVEAQRTASEASGPVPVPVTIPASAPVSVPVPAPVAIPASAPPLTTAPSPGAVIAAQAASAPPTPAQVLQREEQEGAALQPVTPIATDHQGAGENSTVG